MHDALDINLNLMDTSRAPLTGMLGTHESNYFSSSIAINPLIAAATPLINIATGNVTCPSADTLQSEMRVFEHQAHLQGYPPQVILAARYLLCSFIDEKQDSHLLLFFQHESYGGDRFFVILERSCEAPHEYADLLELGYLCLSLGYQGKYREQNQLNHLGIFIDQLYQVLQSHRGDPPQQLLRFTASKQTNGWILPPWWATIAMAGIVLLSVLIPYRYHLNQSIQPLLSTVNHTQQTP